MAGNFKWNGDAFQRQFARQVERGIDAACAYLTAEIKTDISQAGTLRYNPTNKSGTTSKRQKTVYNFTHSRPGNPPYKQTGHLRRSMAWERQGFVGRVGTNLEYARALELGSPAHGLEARPFIRPNFLKHQATITRIITGTIRAGELQYGTTTNRSGHLGAGAREAGFG